jgi:hypothetical protein
MKRKINETCSEIDECDELSSISPYALINSSLFDFSIDDLLHYSDTVHATSTPNTATSGKYFFKQ